MVLHPSSTPIDVAPEVQTSPETLDKIEKLLNAMASEGISHAADGLADMTGQPLTVSQPQVSLVAVSQIPRMLGGPENEAVGIYLQSQGAMPGQMMLVIPYDKALELVDLLMCVPKGTTQHLGQLERSALAEVGNLTGTFFLNAIASMTGLDTRPTPPAVMVDMVAAILDIIVATTGALSDQVFMMRAAFIRDGKEVEANFWMVPDPSALTKLVERGFVNGS